MGPGLRSLALVSNPVALIDLLCWITHGIRRLCPAAVSVSDSDESVRPLEYRGQDPKKQLQYLYPRGMNGWDVAAGKRRGIRKRDY